MRCVGDSGNASSSVYHNTSPAKGALTDLVPELLNVIAGLATVSALGLVRRLDVTEMSVTSQSLSLFNTNYCSSMSKFYGGRGVVYILLGFQEEPRRSERDDRPPVIVFT